MSGTEGQVLDEIARLRPAEMLVPELPAASRTRSPKRIRKLGIKAITARPGWQFTPHHAKEQIAAAVAGARRPAGSGSPTTTPPSSRPAAVLTLSGGDAEDRPRPPPPAPPARRRGPPEHRPGELAQPGDRPHRPLRRHRRARCSRAIDRTRTRMGGRLLRQWLRYAAVRHRAHRRPAGRDRRAARIAAGAARRSSSSSDDVCDIERIVGAARGGPGQPARSGGAGQVPRSRCRQLFDTLEALPRRERRRPGTARACGRSATSRPSTSPARSCPIPRRTCARAA